MGDTVKGRLLVLKKKELTAALGKSSKEEWAKWRAMIDVMHSSEECNNGEMGAGREIGTAYIWSKYLSFLL